MNMSTIEGTLDIRWENGSQPTATPQYKLIFSRYKNHKDGGQPSKLLVGKDALEGYLIEIGFQPEIAQGWIQQVHEKHGVSILNVMMPEGEMAVYEAA